MTSVQRLEPSISPGEELLNAKVEVWDASVVPFEGLADHAAEQAATYGVSPQSILFFEEEAEEDRSMIEKAIEDR